MNINIPLNIKIVKIFTTQHRQGTNMKQPVKKNILGIAITDESRNEILEYVSDFIEKSDKMTYIATPNPEMIMRSRDDKDFRNALNGAGIALCDGVGLFTAAKLLGTPLKERIAGTDFMEELCKQSVKNAVTVGFLGGGPGVAERTAECLIKKYPGLKVAFAAEEWPDQASKLQSLTASEKENFEALKLWSTEAPIGILFVAFGFPKQEEWMADHLEKLPVRVMMGVGGAFDYISGGVSRAPKIIRDLGLEWLYRLIRQPWRLKRQLVLPKFVFLVLKERFSASP
jgi:N-acetylglucosaminyldiphosphoundecaprenol N-acetyl-beta-D-mannosaminyltransferase